MRKRWWLVALVGLWATNVQGDFEAALKALERGDFAAAARELRPQAEANDPHAQYLLGRLFRDGRGVIQDYIQAHRWFNLAAAGGHRHAGEARDRLGQQMTPRQVAQAQDLARTFSAAEDPFAPPSTDSSPARPVGVERLSPPGEIAAGAMPSEGLVARVQLALRRLGYNLELNGVLNGETREAIRDYQLRNVLDIDGLPSDALLTHLQAARNEPPIAAGDAPKTPPPPNTHQWRRVVIQDMFRDGNYDRNPPWEVVSGRFWVEGQAGLRSGPVATATNTSAEIHRATAIPASFAVEMTIDAQTNEGYLEFGPYTDADTRSGGYRLRYEPGEVGSLTLVKQTRRSAGVLDRTRRRLNPVSDGSHQLVWTRDEVGDIRVVVDGVEMLSVRDRAFDQGFAGFTLINRGGDFAMRSIRVKGDSS